MCQGCNLSYNLTEHKEKVLILSNVDIFPRPWTNLADLLFWLTLSCVNLLIYNCLQIMYSFVMRPESLPKAYQDHSEDGASGKAGVQGCEGLL